MSVAIDGGPVDEFHYRLRGRSTRERPGAHVGSALGAGQDFYTLAPFLRSPDPRRLDLRASARDPFEELHVRVYRQRSAIDVFLIADLSASMACPETDNKLNLLTKFARSLAQSCHRHGDAFGFIGGGKVIEPAWQVSPSQNRAGAQALIARLAQHVPLTPGAQGLCHAARHLPKARTLVFLASDFHWDDALIKHVMQSLVRHEVVPIVLWRTAEWSPPRRFGLLRIRDSEAGNARLILLTPGMKKHWASQAAARRQHLKTLLMRFGREPYFVVDHFDALAMTQYFQG